jgi:gamma-glutamylcyclotransferase (GGCT)/AIG2-like uncharacterized protein YtfP
VSASKDQESSCFVFVYGTLRKEAQGTVQTILTAGWSFVGYGSVAAELYDLGAYPGAVPSGTPASRVRGELYRAAGAPDSLERLDRHEGEEFGRAPVDVVLDSGEIERAWIYWYLRSPRGLRIRSGDYLNREVRAR